MIKVDYSGRIMYNTLMPDTQDKGGRWFRLDNSADMYPMSTTQTTMSIFRLSVELENYVDGENLATAISRILPRFPTFAVLLRRGLFRYYFDSNDLEPVAHHDDGVVLRKIDFYENNRYLFRVMYYKRRISIDFFHGLCDATGAMEFLKSLVYAYLDECGEPLPDHGTIKIEGEPVPEEELEDSISKYYTHYNLFGGVVNKMAGRDSFGIKAKRFKTLGYGLIQGYVDTKALLDLAHENDCTVTVLISALALFSIYKVYVRGDQSKDLVAMIPINLRKIFPSKTLRNFTTMTKIAVNPASTPPTLKDYIKVAKAQLKKGLADEAELKEKLSFSAFMSSKWYMRYMPVMLKEFFTKAGKALAHNTKQTLIISNYGTVEMPDGMEDFVRRFAFNVNISRKVPVNIGVVSYNGTTSISFTRMLIETAFEREFFTTLSQMGLEVEIASNMRERAYLR